MIGGVKWWDWWLSLERGRCDGAVAGETVEGVVVRWWLLVVVMMLRWWLWVVLVLLLLLMRMMRM